MSTILSARPIRQKRLKILQERCKALKERGVRPSMVVFLVGDDPASTLYVRNKKRFMESWGGECQVFSFPSKVQERDLVGKLQEVGASPGVHGCFVQLPLPSHLQHLDVGQMIPPEKDVDGFHQENLYRLLHGRKGKREGFLPCTPRGILTLLQEYGISLEGKKAVVIGRSMVVGKPMALLFLNHNMTVSVCHSHTQDLTPYTHQADIIVCAIGRAKFFTKDFLHPKRRDQVLIDVGINRSDEGDLCGDMDFQNLRDFCGAITPVPGGVGPMTVLSLAENLLTAAEKASSR